jgi:hypothetical protein
MSKIRIETKNSKLKTSNILIPNLTSMIGTTCKTFKTDLTDVTFLVPLRIDSPERKENIDTLVKYTFQHFNTSFLFLKLMQTVNTFQNMNSQDLNIISLKTQMKYFTGQNGSIG